MIQFGWVAGLWCRFASSGLVRSALEPPRIIFPARCIMARTRFNALPGFGLTLGFTLFYVGVVVLIPVAVLFLKAAQLSWAEFWKLATDPRALAAYRLTFGASCAAALVNAFFGTILAWVLVRYRFPGKRLLDALVDFPFALPTAVAGLTLANLYSAHGWLGQFLLRQNPDGSE